MTQYHNFHHNDDIDWVVFYGLSKTIYSIESIHSSSSCDGVIELYENDGTTLLEKIDDGIEGENESLSWRSHREDIYYLKIHTLNCRTKQTSYGLNIFEPYAEFGPIRLNGLVKDKLHVEQPIEDVDIQLSGCSKCKVHYKTNGNIALYRISGHINNGNYVLIASAPDYQTFTKQIEFRPFDSLSHNIVLLPDHPSQLIGDLNCDEFVNLNDAIVALRIVAGFENNEPANCHLSLPDTCLKHSVDLHVGLEEIIYIMTKTTMN